MKTHTKLLTTKLLTTMLLPTMLLTCGLCLSASDESGVRAAEQPAKRPNIVVILTDDQGWGDLSLNGNRNLSTPNLDRLAGQGASFDRFFVCPVCSPTRAEFLTGRYHPRSGVFSTSAGGERMDLDERTIGDTFSQAGYATAAFGKWHNGMQYPYHPNGRGFGEYYGFCSGHWGDYFSPPLDHNGQIVRGEGFVIDDFTNRAMAFIEAHRAEPFFVYLPYNTPHSPMQVPDRWWNKFQNKELAMHNREPDREDIPHVRAALAMCENIDWNVGRILAKLDELDLAQETIVVYFCDNGPNGVRWNGGMKGRKGSTDEGGVRSPLIARWPNKIPAGQKIMPIAGAIDLLPTLADLAGIPVASPKPLDGVSLKPLLLGDKVAWPDRQIFSHWRGRVSVRTQHHRLDRQGKLYDMSADPGQMRDVAGQFPTVASELRAAVKAWKESLLPELASDSRPFLIGHQDYRYTQMPARDGIAHGNLKRSNRFPNCSYFSNWTSVEDEITWAAEVAADGVYEVELHYACPAADVGSTIELSIGETRLTSRIDKPHQVPARGGEHDRVKRAESYVKDFAVAKLGQMRLTKGQRGMTLRALAIPGSQAMEFRLLMFTRQDDTTIDAPKPDISRPSTDLPGNVQQYLDVVYATYGDRALHLDLFVPNGGPAAKPAVVVVHGGGWLNGDRTKFHALAMALAARGYVTAAIEYRLGGEAKFPAAIHDCNAAVRWLRAHADKHGIDSDRIGAVGGSAGGHLVGLMATSAAVATMQGSGGNADQSSRLQAAVVLAGPLELATGPVADKSRKEPEISNANKWLGKTVDQAPDLYRLASATTHISASTPPILFMTGEHDNPLRNIDTRRRLRELGIPSEIRVYKDGKHGCWNRLPWFAPMIDDIDAFLAATLKKSAAAAVPLMATEWGSIRSSAAGLELVLDRPPADGNVEIPRLNNPVGKIYFKGDAKQTEMKIKPGLRTWSISLPKDLSTSGKTVVVETVGPPHLPTIPRIVSALPDGNVTLPAHDSITHGKLLRYEPQPHKNTVGYWANEKDTCEWHFYLDQAGTFDVHILQGCGKGQGGSNVEISVGKRSLEFVVEDTGHFQNFKDRQIGTITLDEPGLHTLRIRPIAKAKNAVMDVRQLRLVRKAQGD